MEKNELKEAIREVLNEEGIIGTTELSGRWIGGEVIMQPADLALQAKVIPADVFFHKIVMIRDRLRVMEQKINASKKMDDAEKVELQQYITKIYGTLTTFNVLFKEEDDKFRGDSGKG